MGRANGRRGKNFLMFENWVVEDQRWFLHVIVAAETTLERKMLQVLVMLLLEVLEVQLTTMGIHPVPQAELVTASFDGTPSVAKLYAGSS